MAIDEKGQKSFRQLYKEEFGEELPQEEVERKSRILLSLYLAVYQSPMQTIREIELSEVNLEEINGK